MVKIQPVKQRGYLFSFDNFSQYSMNIYLIKGNDYDFIIDTGLGSASMEPVLEYAGKDGKPVIIVNTHYHWDHIWGNHVIKNGLVISHRLGLEMIRLKWQDMLDKNRKYADGKVELRLPNLTFDSEMNFPEEGIFLFHSPGHTVDGISIFDAREKVLIVGDNIGDTPDELVPELDCDRELYRREVEKYLALDFDTCISGHNQLLSKEAMRKVRDLL